LFVPVVGIISPALLGIVPSIEMVIWVALGGRTALAWAAAGAVIVNSARSSISEQFPSTWLYLQGLLFVVVILFLPKGIAGAIEHLRTYASRVPIRGKPRVAPPKTIAVEQAAAPPPKPAPPKVSAKPSTEEVL